MHSFQVESNRSRPADSALTQPLLPLAPGRNLEKHPISLAFKNITYSVKVEIQGEGPTLFCRKKTMDKLILDNVTGLVKAGEVTAILGASGAGKTSLLNAISCRVPKSEGVLLANGIPYDYSLFGDFANYVMQSDVLMETLTIRETLMFAADLRLAIPKQEKKKRVLDLAKSMKLLKCLDVMVGGLTIKGISGGQKKRTSIAFQLISQPQVVVLDEPTSGLDSLTSFIIVDYLHKLAHDQGRTILMTIHQPNNDIFERFDRIFIMVEGRMAYQGPAQTMLSYFEDRFGLTCSELSNPAEFVIEKVHHEDPDNVARYPAYFSTYSQKIAPAVDEEIKQINARQVLRRVVEVSLFTSFGALAWRAFVNLWRNPMLIKSRILQSIVLGVYVGGLYWNDGRDTYSTYLQAFTIVGFFFFISIASLMSTLSPVSLVFPGERAVFLKEESSRLYGTLAYFISKNIIEIPYLVVSPFIFIVIFYWMVGLASTVEQFFFFYLASMLITFCGNSIGMFLGSIVSDQKSVAAVTPAVIVPFILFSGFFKNGGNLPAWVGWIQYISPIKYGFQSITTNELGSGSPILGQLNFNMGYWQCVGMLAVLSVGFGLVALFFLWFLRSRME